MVAIINLMVFLFLLTLVSLSFSQECKPVRDYYQDRERGWFWREVCVKEEKKKEEKKKEERKTEYKTIPNKVRIPWDKIDQLDPEEIAKLEKESRKIAIMYPTEENVREYYRLQRYILTKSREFAVQIGAVSRTEPALFQRPQYPVVREIWYEEKQKKMQEVFTFYRNKAGIVAIGQRDCPYCIAFEPVLREFGGETGWQVRMVYMEDNPQLAINLGTQLTPDIFLVVNTGSGNRWERIGSGFMPLDELKKSVLFGLYRLGELKDESLLIF